MLVGTIILLVGTLSGGGMSNIMAELVKIKYKCSFSIWLRARINTYLCVFFFGF